MIIRNLDRLNKYKEQVKAVWDGLYKKDKHRAIHQAGTAEQNVALAKLETDLFLFPTKEKCEQITEYLKKNHPKIPPTFTPDFYEHKPISEYLGDLKNCIVLDYGCGGLLRYSRHFSKYFEDVIAIDASDEAIQWAQNIKKDLNLKNVDIMQNDGTSVTNQCLVPEKSVDFIFSNLVFQHIGNKEIMIDLISDLADVLICGGVFRASFWTEEKSDEHENAFEGTGFSIDEFQEIFKKHGLIPVTVTHKFPVMWITAIKK